MESVLCISRDYTGAVGYWEEEHTGKVPFSLNTIKGIYYLHDITDEAKLNPLAEVAFIRFLHRKVTLPCLERSYHVTATLLRAGELCPISLKREYLHKLFGVLYHLFIQSFIGLESRIFIS